MDPLQDNLILFTGKMSSVIKKNAGRGGSVHQEVGVPKRGWRRSLIRKMLEMMTSMERDPTAQQAEWGGGDLSVWFVSGCQVMTRDSRPTRKVGPHWENGCLWFSQWLDNMVSINSKSCPGSWNSKSFFSLGRDERWVRVTSTATLPKLLPLHKSATPHKVSLLPNCTFYLSVSYLSFENLSEISWSVFEGVFLFSNVLITACRFMKEKFH